MFIPNYWKKDLKIIVKSNRIMSKLFYQFKFRVSRKLNIPKTPTTRSKTLLDLPVYPKDRDASGETDLIQDTYLAELKEAVGTKKTLHAFIDRWKNIWLLRRGPLDTNYYTLNLYEFILLQKTFSYKQVKKYYDKKKSLVVLDDPNARVMVQLSAPSTLVNAAIISNNYGVSTDLAMVRLYLDSWPALSEALR